MKNKRAIVMMAVAVLFGLAAMALASIWLLRQPNANARQIVVAAKPLPSGKLLTKDMLKMSNKSVDPIPKGAETELDKLVDRVTQADLAAEEPILEKNLAPKATGLSATITKGNRAITVRVNDVVGVAGFALPGNFVDVIVSTQKDAPNGERNAELNVSKIVLERILVLAVAQDLGRDESKPRVVNAVTLEVTPAQAELLDLARSVGSLSLALRNQNDDIDIHSDGATKRILLDEALPPPKVVAVVAPKPVPRPSTRPVVLLKRHCVSVLNGVNVSQECF